jgi:two-component system cell cycle sensor histidine kinase/response regulator CckA
MHETQTSPTVNSQSILVVDDCQPVHARDTILLVEDEALVRESTAEILVFAGYRVLKSSNAAEAMGIFRRFSRVVGLLLTDVVLPGRSGRDLARDLRAKQPGLRIIFISGYPENAVTRNGIEEGDGMFYLPKPYSFQSLTRKVKQVLDAKRCPPLSS